MELKLVVQGTFAHAKLLSITALKTSKQFNQATKIPEEPI
jgi:hypothetical protein